MGEDSEGDTLAEWEKRRGYETVEVLIRKYGRAEEESSTSESSRDGRMVPLRRLNPPRSSGRARKCVVCGVYEPLQNATTGCCWALRRERCIFPCGVVPDGIEWGSDDRGGDSGETSGEREPRRAPDDAERFADAWRSVVTEREANQSDVDMSGRDSAEQGMPPGGDRLDLVCVGCGAER